MTAQQMIDTIHGVPAGVDLTELCTLQRVANGWSAALCDECRDLLGQLLAHVGADR